MDLVGCIAEAEAAVIAGTSGYSAEFVKASAEFLEVLSHIGHREDREELVDNLIQWFENAALCEGLRKINQ